MYKKGLVWMEEQFVLVELINISFLKYCKVLICARTLDHCNDSYEEHEGDVEVEGSIL